MTTAEVDFREPAGMELAEIGRMIKKNLRLFYGIILCCVAGTIIVSLFMTNIYRAKAIIIPAGVISKDQGASTFLAVQFGIAPPVTPASSEILNLLKSNVLRERAIRRYQLLPLFFTKSEMEGKTENKLMWMGIRYLDKITDVTFIQKDNLIEFTVDYPDPVKATEMANHLLTELNEHMSGEAKRVSIINTKYLQEQVDETNDPVIRDKLYSLIAKEVLTQAMSEAKENFSFKILDPPMVPDRKISPKRALMAIIALVVSSMLAVVVVVLKEVMERQGVKWNLRPWRRKKRRVPEGKS